MAKSSLKSTKPTVVVTNNALRVRKHRSNIGDEKVREQGRRNTAAHRNRKENEKNCLQEWINHYRGLLREPLLDFSKKEKSPLFIGGRPTYHPPEEVASKMTPQELSQWRHEQKRERKRNAQAKADREKREELVRLHVEFHRVQGRCVELYGPGVLVRDKHLSPPNSDRAGEASDKDTGPPKSDHADNQVRERAVNKWKILNQVTSTLLSREDQNSQSGAQSHDTFEKVDTAKPAAKEREKSLKFDACEGRSERTLDEQAAFERSVSEETFKTKVMDKRLSEREDSSVVKYKTEAAVPEGLVSATGVCQANQGQAQDRECEQIFLPLIEQLVKAMNSRDAKAASEIIQSITAQKDMLTPSFLEKYPLGRMIQNVRSTFENKNCKEVFLPLLDQLRRAKNNCDLKAVSEIIDRIMANSGLLTPSFLKEYPIGQFIRAARQSLENSFRDLIQNKFNPLEDAIRQQYSSG